VTIYILRRMLGGLFVLWAVATLVFGMIKLAPGDPAYIFGGMYATPEDLAVIRHSMGLDQPVYVQYWTYVSNAARGNLGQSLFTHTPVTELLIERAPATIEITMLAALVASILGVLLGAIAAVRRDSVWDRLVRTGTLVGVSIPNFWLALMLLFIFGLYIPGVLPPGGWVAIGQDPIENLRNAVLPVIVLGFPTLAIVARTLRTSMLDTLSSDYIVFARAMGLPERKVVRSVALPNGIIPTATVIALAIGYLVGGTVIVEVVFTIPGVGQLMIDSFQKRDYPVAIGCTLFVATFFVVLNFVVDLLYAAINPKIRELYERQVSLADV
jgi:peptide/nickel transport system permease protein